MLQHTLILLITVFAVSSGHGLDMDKSLSMREKTEMLQNDNLWSLSKEPPPQVPAWPDQFNTQIYIYVKEYGSQWKSTGVVYYDWKVKTFRADYLKWCLPLFDSGSSSNNKYTCSFLATEGNLYFVNHTSSNWEDTQCCLFAKGLGAVPPNWMNNCQYNGTAKIQDELCDVWWFPGTSDPENPCYGYWNKKGTNTPVQFFGLSSVGATILEYFNFSPGQNPSGISLKKPNDKCDETCHSPLADTLLMTRAQYNLIWWPDWPSCD